MADSPTERNTNDNGAVCMVQHTALFPKLDKRVLCKTFLKTKNVADLKEITIF
jgi:hypothetical protein